MPRPAERNFHGRNGNGIRSSSRRPWERESHVAGLFVTFKSGTWRLKDWSELGKLNFVLWEGSIDSIPRNSRSAKAHRRRCAWRTHHPIAAISTTASNVEKVIAAIVPLFFKVGEPFTLRTDHFSIVYRLQQATSAPQSFSLFPRNILAARISQKHWYKSHDKPTTQLRLAQRWLLLVVTREPPVPVSSPRI